MLYFKNDYSEGAAPEILRRLQKTNLCQQTGYGDDEYCLSAKEKIKAAIGRPDAEVYLLTGGTQTNQIVIDTCLSPYEGVIAAETGHVAAHEAGAIEFTGHKVLTLPQKNGKISAEDVKNYIEKFYRDGSHTHMVFPGMVYVSHPTEYGTLYKKEELCALSSVCREYKIPLYLDGARLGYGLCAESSDMTLSDIAELCDVFYIGGTKVGALCGEAVVFSNMPAPKGFFTSIKQHGALLAKGRLLGVQFDTLFTDNLYFRLAERAISAAKKLRAELEKKGYREFIENDTNQIFVILSKEKFEKLSKEVVLEVWEEYSDTDLVVRIATSWATNPRDVRTLGSLL